ncbi:F-box protein PP2-A15-like isoform X2 [Musa acuminata AAA Group]|uniref:F-box protein PP2-A15-like isoform X2 n=1 Tax=Musa acuminata AAA Group TaxID=214697 RepID=UPI0031DF1250
MGASLSNLTEAGSDGSGGPGLGDIPESCVACVFTYLTPPEICNLARLNRAFRGAASSDSVWEPKLPSTYPQLLSLLPPETVSNRSPLSKKKDIFAFLSRPIPFDEGTKVLWLDRATGGVCLSVSAKGMTITGIEDRRYWSWIPTEESSRSSSYIRWWCGGHDSSAVDSSSKAAKLVQHLVRPAWCPTLKGYAEILLGYANFSLEVCSLMWHCGRAGKDDEVHLPYRRMLNLNSSDLFNRKKMCILGDKTSLLCFILFKA